MINKIIDIANKAGEKILEIYEKADFSITYKNDKSPLTIADIYSNKVIIENLNKISNLPILSEERYIDYSERKKWKKYWLVDPLDGTKDFICRDDNYY